MKALACIITAAFLFQGCAANMAVQGKNGPDMAVVERQQTREDVERILGTPADTIRRSDGALVDLYIVEAKTEPSVARATGHATASLFTFGLWDLVGGPIEAYKGRRQRVVVEYDHYGRVVSLFATRSRDQELMTTRQLKK